MDRLTGWRQIRDLFKTAQAQLRFCLRVTASGLLAFALAQALTVPLHGLWVILTAVVVTQMSAGGSFRASVEYIIGTLGGGVYAAITGVFIPHATPLAEAGVLALTIAPLALAAAFNPNFRVAPFSAVLVLLIAGQLGQGPMSSALTRLLEVALGGAVAITVSLLVFPQRAHDLGRKAAAGMLDRMARILPQLLTGFARNLDPAVIGRIQDDIGGGVARFQEIVAEVKHEPFVDLTADPDPGPLSRTLLRLRHDLVIIGRAASTPLPDAILHRLGPPLTRFGAAASDFLRGCGAALAQRSNPPPLDAVETALTAYTAEVAALRGEGLTRPLSSSEVEQVFALGFALEQLHQNFIDLRRCVQDYAPKRRA